MLGRGAPNTLPLFEGTPAGVVFLSEREIKGGGLNQILALIRPLNYWFYTNYDRKYSVKANQKSCLIKAESVTKPIKGIALDKSDYASTPIPGLPGATANLCTRAVTSLRAYERNARTHTDAQIEQIARSIEAFGWTNPILITDDGMIVAGHGRVRAAEKLGMTGVPILVVDGWSSEQIRAYIIADNKLAENAGWDQELLAAELADLESLGFDINVIGFSDLEMKALRPDTQSFLVDPDECPEPRQMPVSSIGDLWVLSDHRVLCGDSTSPADIALVMSGALADACWTDPPYNVKYETSAGSIANDDLPDSTFAAFLLDAFVAVFESMKSGAAIYVAHADTEGLNFRAAFKSAGFKLSGCLVWIKDSLVLGRSDYQWRHEPILYGWKPGAAHRWFGGRKKTTVSHLTGSVFSVQADGTLLVRVDDQTLILRGKDITVEAIEPTDLHYARPRSSAHHPTMKPVELISRMLRNSTTESQVILDPFGGSGSTLIACEMLNRCGRLVELDPRYVDVIVERWQQFTGGTATLGESGPTFDEIARNRRGSESSDLA